MRPSPMAPSRAPLQIGARLRAVRTGSGFTLEQVAEATGLTKGFISRIERDDTSPSVQTLVAICEAMSIPVGSLFEAPDVSMVKGGDASTIISISGTGAQEYLLTPRGQSTVQLVRSRYLPGSNGGEKLYTLGANVEIAHVLSGRLDIVFATSREELSAGDTLTFHGQEPHTWLNPDSDVACEVVWVFIPAPWVSGALPGRGMETI